MKQYNAVTRKWEMERCYFLGGEVSILYSFIVLKTSNELGERRGG